MALYFYSIALIYELFSTFTVSSTHEQDQYVAGSWANLPPSETKVSPLR